MAEKGVKSFDRGCRALSYQSKIVTIEEESMLRGGGGAGGHDSNLLSPLSGGAAALDASGKHR